ncbi:MAG: hypothetical protein PHX34_02585 [Candidatus Shapirobacteria bacterium]|nr:hypothetical protein [Candidatus Shapirobacteria bacterium]
MLKLIIPRRVSVVAHIQPKLNEDINTESKKQEGIIEEYEYTQEKDIQIKR